MLLGPGLQGGDEVLPPEGGTSQDRDALQVSSQHYQIVAIFLCLDIPSVTRNTGTINDIVDLFVWVHVRKV